MKKALPLLALALLALPVYAALIQLSSDIDQIGGTGEVSVSGPGTISKVKWTLTGTAPYRVSAVRIMWDAEEDNSKYTVYVIIYNNNEIKGYGSIGNQGGSGTIETTISLNTNVNPKDISKVEIIIVEE